MNFILTKSNKKIVLRYAFTGNLIAPHVVLPGLNSNEVTQESPKSYKNAYQSVVCPVSVEEEGSPDWAPVWVGVSPVEELGEVVLMVRKREGAVKA